MTLVTEREVAEAAYYMGYALLKCPQGYELHRRHDAVSLDVIEAPSLELICIERHPHASSTHLALVEEAYSYTLAFSHSEHRGAYPSAGRGLR